MKITIFYLGFGFLFTHELDAVINHEWRVLPLTNWLSEVNGQLVFISAHIPIIATLLALISSRNSAVRYRSRIGISLFLIAHGVLHALYFGTQQYEFSSLFSNILIFGGGILGMTHLMLELNSKKIQQP